MTNMTEMQIIHPDVPFEAAHILDGYDCPAILVSPDYEVMAANKQYTAYFGRIGQSSGTHCYEVSHGYDKPCDRCGESCPLSASLQSGEREKVLHIHNTPRGKEYVDVELLPIKGKDGKLTYFVELLKTVSHASAQENDEQMVGISPAFHKVVDMINRVGPNHANVLLLGESGTGKELAAQAIHQASQRKTQPFVIVECSGLSETLFESELFGHVKGAFTGATYNRSGLVETASKGTLFLDEIGDIPLPLQVKLLRLIETGTYRPVGSEQEKVTDFRLICATHKNLRQMVDEGKFRKDLFFRINVFPIYLPNLRERIEDIPLLAKSIIPRVNEHMSISKNAQRWLMRYPFEGNIRELRNLLERACLFETTHQLSTEALDLAIEAENAFLDQQTTNNDPLKMAEQKQIDTLMRANRGDKKEVARALGISERTLYRKLKSHIN
jgi:transcriptional regulator with PAS, ATPase and Fis domain